MSNKRKTHRPGHSGNPAAAGGPPMSFIQGMPELIDMSKIPEEERAAIAQDAFYKNMAQLPPLLATMLTGLRMDVQETSEHLRMIAYTLTPPMDKFHVPAVSPLDLNAPDHRFRVYCLACSEQAKAYVYPCLIGNDPAVDVAPMPCTDVLHIPPSLRGKQGPLIIWDKQKEAPDEHNNADSVRDDHGAEGESPEGVRLSDLPADEAPADLGDGAAGGDAP